MLPWMKDIKDKVTLGEDWLPVDREAYLSKINPDLLASLEESDSVYPFYIRLLKAPFKDWILEISSFDEKQSSFVMHVDLLPKSVDTKEFKKLEKKLKTLSSNIANAILVEALEVQNNQHNEHQ